MIETTCLKCHKKYNPVLASCGAGSTWSLEKCPHCLQLFASSPSGRIPEEILNDPEIVTVNYDSTNLDNLTLEEYQDRVGFAIANKWQEKDV